jgi:hypothetical protein
MVYVNIINVIVNMDILVLIVDMKEWISNHKTTSWEDNTISLTQTLLPKILQWISNLQGILVVSALPHFPIYKEVKYQIRVKWDYQLLNYLIV